MGPWAPDNRAGSLSPLSQAGQAPQGQCVGLGLGTAGERMTAKRGHCRARVPGEPHLRALGGRRGTRRLREWGPDTPVPKPW